MWQVAHSGSKQQKGKCHTVVSNSKKKTGKNGKLIHFESISKSEALCKYYQAENLYGGLDLMN